MFPRTSPRPDGVIRYDAGRDDQEVIAYIVAAVVGDEFMINVVCAICKSEFRIKQDTPNPVLCKICHAPVDVPQLKQRDAETAKKKAKSPKCPGCHKPLTTGVKFCIACGTYTGDVWAAQAASLDADEKLKVKIWWHRVKSWFVRW